MNKSDYLGTNPHHREWLNYKALLDLNLKLDKVIKQTKPKPVVKSTKKVSSKTKK